MKPYGTKGGFLKGFKYAFRGILFAMGHERNFRIHICMVFYVLLFALIGMPSRHDIARLVLCFGLVLASELVNTALESLCDTVTDEENEGIRVAKDACAGAVLVSAVIAAVVGLITFLNPTVFCRVMTTLLSMPYIALFIMLSIPFSVWFVVGWKKK